MRTLLRWVIGLVVLAVLGVLTFGGFIAWSFMTADVDTVGEVEFDRPLLVPPLAESTVDARGRRVYDLTLQRGETDLGRDRLTPTWGINGTYLGPTVRVTRGEEVLMNVTNRLGQESTLHWHGVHLPAAMDGGPHQMVADGDTWSPGWQVDQPAATAWYHPHPHGDTAEHVYRGLAGLFLIDDPAQADAQEQLPSRYGVDDVPVIVQDKQFDGHELDTSHGLFQSTGLLGDTILVNGTPGPYLEVITQRVRLRLLNASNARVFNFHFAGGREYDVVAGDGGLLPAPVRRTHLELSPGERAEIVVELQPGERTVLRSAPLTSFDNRFAGAEDAFDILQLRAADELARSPEVPDRLASAPALDRADAVTTRDFRLSGTSINGLDMDMARIDETVEVDTTELWRITNTDGSPHNFHVHDTQFVIDTVDGRPPPPELAGWKDTVYLPPGREVELLVRFTDYTDPQTPYMYHCHLLRHEDQGMMGQFVVVGPGESTGEVANGHHHH